MHFDRKTLVLLLAALGAGVVIGFLLAPRGSRVDDRSRDHSQDKRRFGTNVVFGNIIVGSNNAPDSVMTLGYDDSGDND